MSGVIVGVGVAAAVASAAYTMSQGTPKADNSANQEVSNASSTAMSARSQLLATAGASAGEPVQPGSTGGGQKLFGN